MIEVSPLRSVGWQQVIHAAHAINLLGFIFIMLISHFYSCSTN
jgi:hypothetical protein